MEEDLFPHVNGQKKVKREWTGMIRENQVPHTMILYGDEGLGKTTAAVTWPAVWQAGKIPGLFMKSAVHGLKSPEMPRTNCCRPKNAYGIYVLWAWS